MDLARTAYLPSTDLVWQANRATRNNVFGLFFPQPIPLPISGPVLGTNNGTNVWGTAAGFLFNWEPFDLGLRKAQVGTARAQEAQAKTAIEVTRQDVAVAAADGFLDAARIAAGRSGGPGERRPGTRAGQLDRCAREK